MRPEILGLIVDLTRASKVPVPMTSPRFLRIGCCVSGTTTGKNIVQYAPAPAAVVAIRILAKSPIRRRSAPGDGPPRSVRSATGHGREEGLSQRRVHPCQTPAGSCKCAPLDGRPVGSAGECNRFCGPNDKSEESTSSGNRAAGILSTAFAS